MSARACDATSPGPPLQHRRFGQWLPLAANGAEPVEVDVEMAVGQLTFVAAGQPDPEGAGEANHGEDEVDDLCLATELAVALALIHDRFDQCRDACPLVAPVGVAEERADQ